MKKRGLIKQYPLLNLESKSYLNKVLSVERQSLVGCWLQKENSGSISYDYSGNQYNGAYAGGLRLGQPGVPKMGYTSPLYAEATENLITNPSFETNVTGWAVLANNTIERSTEQANFGSYSLKCTYQNQLSLAWFPMVLTANPYAFGVWVYVPSDYDGTDLRVQFRDYVGIVVYTQGDVDMTLINQWQFVAAKGTPVGGDLSGNLTIRENGTPATAGRFIYIDGAQCEQKAYSTPTCIGDMGTGFAWTGTPHASTSTRAATYNNIHSAGLANDNLLLNPGFETPGGGGADIWANWEEIEGDGSLDNETVLVHEGNDAYKCTMGPSTATIIRQTFAVTPGKHRLRFWTRGDGVNQGRYSARELITNTLIFDEITGVAGTDYTRVEADFVIPLGGTTMRLQLNAGYPNGSIAYFDACEIRRMDGFLGDEGTLLIWARVADAGAWSDDIYRAMVQLGVDGSNYVQLFKSGGAGDVLSAYYNAGGVGDFVSVDVEPLDFYMFGITWSVSDDKVMIFYNGVQQGATQTGLGTWIGDLAANRTVIGDDRTTSNRTWQGGISSTVLWNTCLTPTQMAYLGGV